MHESIVAARSEGSMRFRRSGGGNRCNGVKLDTENPAGIMQPVSAAQSSDLHPLCDVAIIVLAKFPTPGKAKTRLIPAIGAESAAKVHACCLLHVVKRMQALAPAELIVCFDPPEQREPMQHMLAT